MAVAGDRSWPSDEWEIVEAGVEGRALVADYFAARGSELLVRAEGLDAAGLPLSMLDQSFAEAGLTRRRGVLLARRAGEFLGFALAELSSPGLNLYEILSTFRLFVLPEAEPLAPEVRRALLGGLARFYRSAGRAEAHGFIPCDEIRQHEETGLVVADETWVSWTFDRQTLDLFCAHVDRLFAGVRR